MLSEGIQQGVTPQQPHNQQERLLCIPLLAACSLQRLQVHLQPPSSLPKSPVSHLEVQGLDREGIFWKSLLMHSGPLCYAGTPGRGLLMLTGQH